MENELDNTKLLPSNFRSYAGSEQRIQYTDITRYLDLYTPLERMGLSNNFKAYKWALGYVPEVHNTFLASGIGKSCIDVVADTAVNGKLMFNGDDEICEALELELGETFTSSVDEIFRLSAMAGSCLNRVCFDEKRAFISSVPLGQFKAITDSNGCVNECFSYLDIKSSYDDYHKYVLYEHRYFNKDKKPCAMYKITLLNYANPEKIQREDYEVEDYKLNKDLQDLLSKTYPNVELYKEDILPFKESLGASLTNWTNINSFYRSLWFGDAMLVNVLDLLYSYDSAFTLKENDKYLGRGRVLVPKQMQQGSLTLNRQIDRAIASKVSMANLPSENLPRMRPLDKTFYQELTNTNGEAIKPEAIQFNLRTAEWATEMSQLAGDIAARLNISACDLDARLNGGMQRTATEINKESDSTIKLVNKKRIKFNTAITSLVKDVAYYLFGSNYIDKINALSISYPSVGLSNPQVATQVVLSQYQGHLLSRYSAIKSLHPEWTETDIKEEMERLDEDAMLINEIDTEDNDIN